MDHSRRGEVADVRVTLAHVRLRVGLAPCRAGPRPLAVAGVDVEVVTGEHLRPATPRYSADVAEALSR